MKHNEADSISRFLDYTAAEYARCGVAEWWGRAVLLWDARPSLSDVEWTALLADPRVNLSFNEAELFVRLVDHPAAKALAMPNLDVVAALAQCPVPVVGFCSRADMLLSPFSLAVLFGPACYGDSSLRWLFDGAYNSSCHGELGPKCLFTKGVSS